MTLPASFPDASTRYRAVHDSGLRKKTQIHYLVIHSTEGSTAEGAAHWFTNKASEGSANLVVGDWVTYKTVPDLVIPWAAPPLNTSGIHIEIVGFAHWPKSEWAKHTRSIVQAGYRAAIRCVWFDIPIVWRSAGDLLNKKHGITSHKNVSDAFHESDHTDPGPNFPYTDFMRYTKHYYDALIKKGV